MNESEKVSIVEESEKAGTDKEAVGSGIAAELSNQLKDYEQSKKIVVNESGDITEAMPNVGKISFGISEKERAIAVSSLGDSLQNMLSGELTHVREMMQRNGLNTAEVDKKIKIANEQVEAVKPLHNAVLTGDIRALQKLVANMKPEDLAAQAELLQKHFDRAGLGIELDFANGQLIVSRSNGDRAVAISKDKTDVIGVNRDGSYDFSRQYRRENPARELQGMTESALSSYLYPPRWGYKQIDHSMLKSSASAYSDDLIRQKSR